MGAKPMVSSNFLFSELWAGLSQSYSTSGLDKSRQNVQIHSPLKRTNRHIELSEGALLCGRLSTYFWVNHLWGGFSLHLCCFLGGGTKGCWQKCFTRALFPFSVTGAIMAERQTGGLYLCQSWVFSLELTGFKDSTLQALYNHNYRETEGVIWAEEKAKC